MKKKLSGASRHCGGVLLLCCTFAFLLSFPLFSFSQGDTWQQKQSLGLAATSRYQAVSFSIGSKGYVGTGRDITIRNDFWEYDPGTNVWTQKANVPGGARSSATGFSLGNKGYIGLGDSTNLAAHYNDFWEYDPATNVWARKADFGGGRRSGATGFSIGSKGYVGTGINNLSVNNNDFWEFDPTSNVWTQKANFGGDVRSGASGFSIGNKGYIGLGSQGPMGLFLMYSDFWEYDPTANIWMQKANFGGEARWEAAGFSVGNKGFLGTGNNGFFSLKDFWEYDQASNAWVQKVNFGGPAREQAISFSIGNKGYIGTGYLDNAPSTFGPINDFWAYDTAVDTWTQKADFGGGPRQNAVGFSIAGKGYVGTGYDGSPKKDFWEYDTAANQWSQKADFAGGQRREAIGFGIGGTGYLGTGWVIGRFSFFNDLWRYDPAANAWTSAGAVPGDLPGRAGAFACRIGSKEYVGGGYYFASPISDFWEFDPATGVWTQKAFPPVGVGLSFGIGNKGYGVGPIDWEYDPATNVWTQKPNPGIAGIAYTFSSTCKGYALTSNNALWEYDPANDTWASRANFPGPARQGATAFSIGNNGYFGFGSATDGLKNDFWEYIPPAEISIRDAFARPHTLWPPDHKMRSVTVYYRVDDNCGEPSKSLSVTSNEPQTGNRPDWIILDDHHLLLRAEINERRHKERIYYITITARDASGNSATEVVKVVVSRHNRDDHWSEREDDKANMDVVPKGAEAEVNGLTVSAQPNPAQQSFTLVFRSNSDQPIIMRVADILGRQIELRTKVAPNGVLQIGNDYRPGNYYVQVIQGEERVTLHLVKLSK